MNEIKQNVFYIKLYKYCRFIKPLIILLVLLILMFIINISIIKLKYIPSVISLLQKSCQPEVVALVNTAFKTIVNEVYVTGIMFISTFLGLIMIIWNIKRFIDIFETCNKGKNLADDGKKE